LPHGNGSLHSLRQDPTVELVALITTLNQEFDRVATHAVLREVCALALAEGLNAIAFCDLFLGPIPAEVDPCGETASSISSCIRPMFRRAMDVQLGEIGGTRWFFFADLKGNPVPRHS
jgi:hypothetical protein